MCLLYPIAMPIATLLDWVLNDDDDHHGGSNAPYNRGELSALIRIQYEERLAAKRKRKQERKQHKHSKAVQLLSNDDQIGAIDFSIGQASLEHQRASFRAKKSQLTNNNKSLRESTSFSRDDESNVSVGTFAGGEDNGLSHSIHIDEVTMVEGALSMKVKCALDVFTPLKFVFSIPDTTVLSESGIVRIYASGFSRIPVYRAAKNKSKENNRRAIVGILLTKQLMVVNPTEKRPITSMPLYTPLCVDPKIPLVHLINIFQTGSTGTRGGHLALVCARPSAGNDALKAGKPLPESAGLMGIITLEDVIETILQEEIYDENDRYERQAHLLARLITRHWRRYVAKKKAGIETTKTRNSSVLQPALRQVIADAMDVQQAEEGRVAADVTIVTQNKSSDPGRNEGTPTESTSLLRGLFSLK